LITSTIGNGIVDIKKKKLQGDVFVPVGTDIDIYIEGIEVTERDDFMKRFIERVSFISGYPFMSNYRSPYCRDRFLFHTGKHPLVQQISVGLDVCMTSGLPDADVNQIVINANDGTIQLGRGYEETFPYKWWDVYECEPTELSFFAGAEDRRRSALKKVIENIKCKKSTLILLPYRTWKENATSIGISSRLKMYSSYVGSLINYRMMKLIDDGFQVSGLACKVEDKCIVCPLCDGRSEVASADVCLLEKEDNAPFVACEMCDERIMLL
jgi:hypothetical protein